MRLPPNNSCQICCVLSSLVKVLCLGVRMLVYTELRVLNVNGQTGTSVIKPHTNSDVHGRIVDHPNFMRKLVNRVKTLPRMY